VSHDDNHDRAPYARMLVISLSAVVSEVCGISVVIVQAEIAEMAVTGEPEALMAKANQLGMTAQAVCAAELGCKAIAALVAKVRVEEACKGRERAVVHCRFAAFLVRLAGRGDAIGEGCVSGAGGAGSADGAVGSTEGGSSEGEGARFIRRGS
jgi:hypothetical protein